MNWPTVILIYMCVCHSAQATVNGMKNEPNWDNATSSIEQYVENSSLASMSPSRPVLSEGKRIAQFLAELGQNKDNLVRPGFGDKPIIITSSIIVNAVKDVSDRDMTYQLDFFYTEVWIDRRLAYNDSVYNRESMKLPYDSTLHTWVPDTYLVNSDQAIGIDFFSMSHKYGIRLSSDGKMVYSKRISASLSCDMDLAMYPFDDQKCLLTMSSYFYMTRALQYKWNDTAIGGTVRIGYQMPYFNLIEMTHYLKNLTYHNVEYSTLEVCLLFRRNAGFCYMQLVIPAGAVVLTSWIALWLEEDTQINDLLTTLLAILFLSYSYNSMMPSVSYIKAMDMYLMACFMFIFLSLAKLIVVKVLKMRAERKATEIVECHEEENTLVQGKDGPRDKPQERLTRAHLKEIRRRVFACYNALQVGSQLILPVLFVGFCVVFFLIYPASVPKPSCRPTDQHH